MLTAFGTFAKCQLRTCPCQETLLSKHQDLWQSSSYYELPEVLVFYEGYTAIEVTERVQMFNWEVLDHLAHSPDFGSNIFHLSSNLKKHLVATSFTKTER